MTARKLDRPLSRASLGKERLAEPGVLLVGDGEFMAALGAAAFEDVAAGFGGHPFAEAVVVFAFTVRWLKRSFHITLDKKA